MALTPPQVSLPSAVRVALLICDEHMKLETFKEWLNNALPSDATIKLEMKPYNAYLDEFPTSDEIRNLFDVIIITGSRKYFFN